MTLVGMGGSGKTRCAIQTGAELLDRFIDGVWLIDLAPLSDLLTGPVAEIAQTARRARSCPITRYWRPCWHFSNGGDSF